MSTLPAPSARFLSASRRDIGPFIFRSPCSVRRTILPHGAVRASGNTTRAASSILGRKWDAGDSVGDRDIESALREEREFPPPAAFAARARIGAAEAAAMRAEAAADHVGFWAGLARRSLHWHRPFTVALDDSRAPNYRWFTDGELNVAVNCLDVHLERRGEQAAILFEGEAGDVRRFSYRELHAEVCRLANGLKSLRIGRGDRVVIYMPMVPEAVIAMLACARIGAVHSVVFGGFAAQELAARIDDATPTVVVSASCGIEVNRVLEYKPILDRAIGLSSHKPPSCVILQRPQ